MILHYSRACITRYPSSKTNFWFFFKGWCEACAAVSTTRGMVARLIPPRVTEHFSHWYLLPSCLTIQFSQSFFPHHMHAPMWSFLCLSPFIILNLHTSF